MAIQYSVVVKNSTVIGKTIEKLHTLIDKDFVVSRLCRANGKVEIPTPKGKHTIDVAPLTQSNTKFTLKGKGIKFLKGMGSGDLIATVKGEMPKDLDKSATKLIKELEKTIHSKAYPKTNKYKDKLDN